LAHWIGASNNERILNLETFNFDKLAQQLIQEEGNVPHAYPDGEGYLTIGIGHLIDPRKGGSITQDTIMYIFNLDVQEKVNQLDQNLSWWRNENEVRQRVMIDLCFNLGITGLLGFHNTLKHWQAGEYEQAAQGLLDSKAAQQTGKRYQKLAQMLKTGEDV
jgi:lysozyme